MAILSAPQNFANAVVYALLAAIDIFVQITLILLWFIAAKNLTHGVLSLFSNHPRHGVTSDRLIIGTVLVGIALGLHYTNIIAGWEIIDEVAILLGVLMGLGVDQQLKRVW